MFSTLPSFNLDRLRRQAFEDLSKVCSQLVIPDPAEASRILLEL